MCTGSRKHLNVLEERQRSSESKTSLDSEKIEDCDKISTDDLPALSIDALKLRCTRRRDSIGTGRRSSEGNGKFSSASYLLFFSFTRQFNEHIYTNLNNELSIFIAFLNIIKCYISFLSISLLLTFITSLVF